MPAKIFCRLFLSCDDNSKHFRGAVFFECCGAGVDCRSGCGNIVNKPEAFSGDIEGDIRFLSIERKGVLNIALSSVSIAYGHLRRGESGSDEPMMKERRNDI